MPFMSLLFIAALACYFTPLATAQADAPLIPLKLDVQTVAEGFTFTEGPALAPDGSIYFSDIPKNSVHRYDPATGETTRFTDDSRGTNGMTFVGRFLVACEDREGRRVSIRPIDEAHTTFDPSQVIAADYEGKRFNGPNDVVAITAGVIYFTDPAYRREDLDLFVEGVYAVLPANDNNSPQVVQLISTLDRPNGIGVSPDEKTLYINDNRAQKVYAYTLAAPDRATDERVLIDLADLGGPDGLTVDAHGRLYIAIFGKGVLVATATGERLGFIEIGPNTTNCAFGADGKTLYITADGGLKSVVLNTDSATGRGPAK